MKMDRLEILVYRLGAAPVCTLPIHIRAPAGCKLLLMCSLDPSTHAFIPHLADC